MKYLAIAVLGVVGMVEFVLRLVFTLFLVITIIGIIAVMELIDSSDKSGPDALLKPYCFELIEKILESDKVSAKQLATLQRDNRALIEKNNELVETIVNRAELGQV